jgi:hypothetical protein
MIVKGAWSSWTACFVATLALVGAAPGAVQDADPPTELVWTCPVHAIVVNQDPGKCPICRRELILVNATVSWRCPNAPAADLPGPGVCPDGSAAEAAYTQQAHANHNPQHGGLFFMAPDNWHHLEGTLSRDGTFRVYLYDDYTKPLAEDLTARTTGRLVTREAFDSATRTTTDLEFEVLESRPGGAYLEAHVGDVSVPAEMTAKLKFTPDLPEYRFDFAFPAFSDEQPLGGPVAPVLEVPDAAAEVLSLLGERVRLVAGLVKRGAFGEVWVPALQAKDLALALDARVGELPRAKRSVATASVERLVRAAWQLDEYGDLGNREQVERAHAAFSDAAADLVSVFAPLRERRPR